MEAAAIQSEPRISVRRAKQDDAAWLMSELKKFSQFFGTKKSLFSESEACWAQLRYFIDHHVVMIADLGETKPIGFIAGCVTPHLFNPEIKVLAETFWWVAEEYRGSRAGLMLLREFMDWGEKNVDWITMGLETGSPVREDALLKRGFKLQEKSYLREVN